jgi:hypothetical protein
MPNVCEVCNRVQRGRLFVCYQCGSPVCVRCHNGILCKSCTQINEHDMIDTEIRERTKQRDVDNDTPLEDIIDQIFNG